MPNVTVDHGAAGGFDPSRESVTFPGTPVTLQIHPEAARELRLSSGTGLPNTPELLEMLKAEPTHSDWQLLGRRLVAKYGETGNPFGGILDLADRLPEINQSLTSRGRAFFDTALVGAAGAVLQRAIRRDGAGDDRGLSVSDLAFSLVAWIATERTFLLQLETKPSLVEMVYLTCLAPLESKRGTFGSVDALSLVSGRLIDLGVTHAALKPMITSILEVQRSLARFRRGVANQTVAPDPQVLDALRCLLTDDQYDFRTKARLQAELSPLLDEDQWADPYRTAAGAALPRFVYLEPRDALPNCRESQFFEGHFGEAIVDYLVQAAKTGANHAVFLWDLGAITELLLELDGMNTSLDSTTIVNLLNEELRRPLGVTSSTNIAFQLGVTRPVIERSWLGEIQRWCDGVYALREKVRDAGSKISFSITPQSLDQSMIDSAPNTIFFGNRLRSESDIPHAIAIVRARSNPDAGGSDPDSAVADAIHDIAKLKWPAAGFGGVDGDKLVKAMEVMGQSDIQWLTAYYLPLIGCRECIAPEMIVFVRHDGEEDDGDRTKRSAPVRPHRLVPA